MPLPVELQTIITPHITAALFVPDETVVQAAYQRDKDDFPYWCRVWPAAKAVSDFLVLYPEYIQAKFVVELGAGLGLPSLIAARKAASVLCTDYVQEAIAIAQQSAEYNGLQNFSTQVVDWQQFPEKLKPDVVLLSDVNYEPPSFAGLLRLVEELLQKGTTIILATPQRLMAKEFIALLLPSCIKQQEVPVTDATSTTMITVMVLRKQQFL